MNKDVHQKKERKPGRNRRILSNCLIGIGILLIAVPFIITRINTQRNDDIIDEFLTQAEQAANEAEDISNEVIEPVEASANQTDATSTSVETPEATPDTEAVDEPSGNADPGIAANPVSDKKPLMSKEEIKKRMTGVIIIEKIDLRMVIMDGVDEETLRVSAGRMPGTSKLDEIGNCVLAGHRSYTFGKYFNRLDELEAGDQVTIKTLDKTLKYEVFKKFIVEPDDFSITDKNDTDKILTLFTCHPVAIATHRLVIQAKQVE